MFKQGNNHLFQYEEIEEMDDENEETKEKFTYIEIRYSEKMILKGEFLLYNITLFLDSTSITVEQLISIIYLNFIKRVQKHGNSVTVQQTFLKKLQSK